MRSALRVARTAKANRIVAARSYASTSELKPSLAYLKATHPDYPASAATEEFIQDNQHHQLNTYARPPLVFSRGKGSVLWTTDDREYLDFMAGIAVAALGHADEGFVKTMTEQAGKVSHLSNVFWNEWAGELAKSLVTLTREAGGLGLTKNGTDGAKVFFSNSGTEANEGALKFARLYGKTAPLGSADSARPRTGIVCFNNAFHGRSMGALSVTPNPKYQDPFTPLIPDIRVGEYNNMDEETMRALVNEEVCGVIVEPIQGEGGVGTGKVEWLQMLAKRCREVGAVLIYDEIQCGLFRTGTLWSHSSYPADAQPDILTMAKPLANGFPIGAIMVRDRIAETIAVGHHGTTFGGQPLATRLGHYVLSRLSDPSFLKSLNETAVHLDTLLQRLPRMFPDLLKDEFRGRGLMRGIPFKDSALPAELVRLARERGLLILTAGKDAVRLVPPLIITKEQVSHAVGVMESCLHLLQEQTQAKTAHKGKAE